MSSVRKTLVGEDKAITRPTSRWELLEASTAESEIVLIAVDGNGHITRANQKFRDLSRFDDAALIGRHIGVIDLNEYPDSIANAVHRAKSEDRHQHGQFKCRALDGSCYWIDATLSLVRDANSLVTEVLIVGTDTTKYQFNMEQLAASNELLEGMFENFPGGISYMSKDLTLKAANKEFYALLDLPENELPVGSRYEDIIRFNAERGDYGDGDPDELVRERVELAKTFVKHQFERTRPDGTGLEIRGFPLPQGGFVSTYVDITARHKAIALNQRLAQIVEDSVNEIYLFDAKTFRFVQANKSACENLGYSQDELRDLILSDVMESFPADRLRKYLGQPESEEACHLHFDATHRRKDGSRYIVEGTFQTIGSTDDGVVAVILEDVTEKRESAERIVHMATHDSLTGLPNRVLFAKHMEQALERTNRGENFALLCIDLDHFKAVNDTYGHKIGDELLQAVAKRLRVCLRSTDTVARLGGDEFAAILSPIESPEQVTEIATRIAEVIAKPFCLQRNYVHVGSSIGIAVAPVDGSTFEGLLQNADMAMYRAKSEGRGNYHFFEPKLDAEMRQRRKLELELISGLDREEFTLHYQPIINVETNQITTMEALVRWNHPVRGLLSPAAFIPLAEETGLIRKLGNWVLKQACHDALGWSDTVRVAVNLSPIQFTKQDVFVEIREILEASNFPASRLELEITESLLLKNTDKNLNTLLRLHDLGVSIAMDDFGSGYSSLGYLRRFPFDKIKIDRSFISEVANECESLAIVRAVATLARELGISTLAEGVETVEQREIVHAEGCTEMQGYLFSPPRPLDEVGKMFDSGAKDVSSAA